MRIRDLLDSGGGHPAVTVGMDTPLQKAAQVLRDTAASALIVLGDRGMVGTLSDYNVVCAVARQGAGIALLKVRDAMDRRSISCDGSDEVGATLDRMAEAGVHHIVVVDHGAPATMLTAREFEVACRHLTTEAETDDLTGLANRRGFLRAVEAELNRYRRHQSPMAVAMMDLDHFKHINDQLGHAAGDRLLCDVARRLSDHLRSFDQVARIGGDEFAVLFPQTLPGEAVQACRRLVECIRSLPLASTWGGFRVGLSCGVAVATAHDVNAVELLARADVNLYRAKKSGRGKVVGLSAIPLGHLMSA